MKNKHKDCFRGFIQLSKAWYGESNLLIKNQISDEVSFGFYSPGGGTTGELVIEWQYLSGKFVPCLKIFCDAWNSLAHMTDLIDLLGKHDSEDSSPEEFCEFLLQCGFKNMTEINNPYIK